MQEKQRERIVGTSEFPTLGAPEEVADNSRGTNQLEQPESPLSKFWDSLHKWANFTTLHGVRYVFDPRSHILRRSVWFILIICLLFLLVWIGQKQMNRYFQYKTVTAQTVSVHEKLKFPSITVCNQRFIRNNSIINDTDRMLLKELLSSEPNKTRLKDTFGELYLNNTGFGQLLTAHFSSIDDFILSCKWKGEALNSSEYFSRRLTENGLCYMMASAEDTLATTIVGDIHGLEMVLWAGHDLFLANEEAAPGIKVSVHDPLEEGNMDLAYLIGPDFLHFTAVSTNVYDYMPYPVTAFGGQYCIDTRSDAELYGHYSVTTCLRKCRQNYVQKQCGCLSPFEKEDHGDESDCGISKVIDCYKPTLLSYMSQIEKCHCPTPCHVTKYRAKQSSTRLPEILYKNIQEELSINTTVDTMRENIILLKVFFESKEVIYYEQILEFTFEDLWASFGGYIGLAVGASFVTFLEIVDLFVMYAFHYFRNIRRLVREPT